MSRIIVALSIAVLGLAASTGWLAFQLHAARAELSALRAGPAPATSPSASALPESTPTKIGAPPGSFKITKPDLGADGQPDDMRAQMRASMQQQLPYMRATLEDPEKRAAFLREVKENHLREFPQLAGHLGLTDDESDRLANILAEQMLRLMEMRYRCALNPNCDEMTFASGFRQTSDQELIELLGAERKQRFDEYRDNMNERHQIMYLRGEMPDALRLTDVQAEKLAAVLGDERRKMLKEWEQRGAGYAGRNTGYGSIYYPETAQGVEQRVAEATEFQRRQRERAAEVMNAKQLDYYTRRQQEAMEQLRKEWEFEMQSGNPNPE